MKIKENKIRCLKCGDIIVSENVHDCKAVPAVLARSMAAKVI